VEELFDKCHEAHAVAFLGGLASKLVQAYSVQWFDAIQLFPPTSLLAHLATRTRSQGNLCSVIVEDGWTNRIFGQVLDYTHPDHPQELWFWPPLNVMKRTGAMATGALRDLDEHWINSHIELIRTGYAVAYSITDWERFLRLKPERRRAFYKGIDNTKSALEEGHLHNVIEGLGWC
jgi:hypothetical protein